MHASTIYPGAVYRPTPGGHGGRALACPASGSFQSLEERYAANRTRFKTSRNGRTITQNFRQAPKARFQSVTYGGLRQSRLFELRAVDSADRFAAWAPEEVYALVVAIRDAAVGKLAGGLPAQIEVINRCLVGRRADGTNGGSPADRIHLLPLPTLRHMHADENIRRLFVQIPSGCALSTSDVWWAFSGLRFGLAGHEAVLTPANEDEMERWYRGSPHGKMHWQTVTPVALPQVAARRRIEPTRRIAEAKGPHEKGEERQRAAFAVKQSLRQAGIRNRVEVIVVQREPFTQHGQRAEAFAPASRFAKERLWHVKLVFTSPCHGPLAIGDGRFSGLGLLAPFEP